MRGNTAQNNSEYRHFSCSVGKPKKLWMSLKSLGLFKKIFQHVDKGKKQKTYFERKLSENIGKPKELCTSLKSLSLKFKRSFSNINCLQNNKSANFDIKDIADNYSAYFSNLA